MQDPVIGTEEGKEERAVPGLTDLGNVCKHISRYNLALMHAQKKVVIDAACGSGYGSFLLGMVASKVIGVDIAQPAIDYAASRFMAPNVEFRTADVCSLTESADLIVSFETVEHLESLESFERMIGRCLKPGGLLVFSVPLNEAAGFNPYHKHVFTYDQAKLLFPSLRPLDEAIQHGINFYPAKAVPLQAPWLAYIGILQKPA